MKRLFIIFILLTIIAFLVTAILIIDYKISNYKSPEMDTAISDIETNTANKNDFELYPNYRIAIQDNAKGASKNQTISTNGISFEKYKYEDEKVIGNIIKISGLKDKTIEDKVNILLKNKTIEFGNNIYDYIKAAKYDEKSFEPYYYSVFYDGDIHILNDFLKDKPSDWKIHIDEAVLASFSNVISIMLSMNSEFYPTKSIGAININLTNGEELKLEDLFTKDADILRLYSNEVYKEYGDYNTVEYSNYEIFTDKDGAVYEYGEGKGFFEEVDVTNFEKLIKKFKSTKDIEFAFTDEYLSILFDNKISTIYYKSHYDDIAIFNRFVTDESIFDGNKEVVSNVPAYFNITTGDVIKYNKTFEKNGNVVQNYYVFFEGDYELENKNKDIIKYAINKIKSEVDEDVARINESYSGEEVVLYSGTFRINIGEVDYDVIEDKYESFFKEGQKYFYIDSDVDVSLISKDDLELIENDFCKYIYSIEFSNIYYNKYYYDPDNNYEEIVLFEKETYDYYYNSIRKDDYDVNYYSWNDGKPSYSKKNDVATCYLVNDNYREIRGKVRGDYFKTELIENYLFKDGKTLDDLAYKVFDNIENKLDYSSLSKYGYMCDFYLSNEKIPFSFDYYENKYYTGWSTLNRYVTFTKDFTVPERYPRADNSWY